MKHEEEEVALSGLSLGAPGGSLELRLRLPVRAAAAPQAPPPFDHRPPWPPVPHGPLRGSAMARD